MITEENLKKRVLSMADGIRATVEKKLQQVIESGCLDMEGAEDNLILPKAVLTAILQREATEYEPIRYEFGTRKKTRTYREFEKEVNNIKSFI